MNKEKFDPQEIEVEDGESWNGFGGSGLGIQGIGLEQFRRCAAEGSKAMTNEQFDVWINCIDRLSDITLPFQKEETEIDLELKQIETNIELSSNSLSDDLIKNLGKTNQIEKTLIAYYELRKNKLYPFYKKKFRLLSILINKYNYFGEESAMGGLS